MPGWPGPVAAQHHTPGELDLGSSTSVSRASTRHPLGHQHRISPPPRTWTSGQGTRVKVPGRASSRLSGANTNCKTQQLKAEKLKQQLQEEREADQRYSDQMSKDYIEEVQQILKLRRRFNVGTWDCD